MACAVYHENGICPGPYGKCDCGLDETEKTAQDNIRTGYVGEIEGEELYISKLPLPQSPMKWIEEFHRIRLSISTWMRNYGIDDDQKFTAEEMQDTIEGFWVEQGAFITLTLKAKEDYLLSKIGLWAEEASKQARTEGFKEGYEQCKNEQRT